MSGTASLSTVDVDMDLAEVNRRSESFLDPDSDYGMFVLLCFCLDTTIDKD